MRLKKLYIHGFKSFADRVEMTFEHGVTGVVVDGRAVPALARAVIGVCADPAKARHMGQEGRRHVVEHWTWEVMGARLCRILAGGGPRG